MKKGKELTLISLRKLIDEKVSTYFAFDGINKYQLKDPGGPAFLQDDKKKDLAIVRLACLDRNKIFQSDCKEMRKLKEEKHPDFKKREDKFFQKWSIDRNGLSLIPEKYVQTVDFDRYGYLTLKIDLLFPKGKLKNRIERLIDKYQRDYQEYSEDIDFDSALRDGIVPKKGITIDEQYTQIKKDIQARKRDAKAKKQFRDIDLYRRYLQIWDLKEEGKSWKEILEILKKKRSPLATKEGIRNAHKAITIMINNGVPGYKKFPSK